MSTCHHTLVQSPLHFWILQFNRAQPISVFFSLFIRYECIVFSVFIFMSILILTSSSSSVLKYDIVFIRRLHFFLEIYYCLQYNCVLTNNNRLSKMRMCTPFFGHLLCMCMCAWDYLYFLFGDRPEMSICRYAWKRDGAVQGN